MVERGSETSSVAETCRERGTETSGVAETCHDMRLPVAHPQQPSAIAHRPPSPLPSTLDLSLASMLPNAENSWTSFHGTPSPHLPNAPQLLSSNRTQSFQFDINTPDNTSTPPSTPLYLSNLSLSLSLSLHSCLCPSLALSPISSHSLLMRTREKNKSKHPAAPVMTQANSQLLGSPSRRSDDRQLRISVSPLLRKISVQRESFCKRYSCRPSSLLNPLNLPHRIVLPVLGLALEQHRSCSMTVAIPSYQPTATTTLTRTTRRGVPRSQLAPG
jgi:hypothetical protein